MTYGSENECAISTTPLRPTAISVVNVTTHAEDHKRQEEWIQYASRSVWVHECCGDENGVIGDEDYICKNCL